MTVTGTGVAFGAYDAATPTAATANGTVTIKCSSGLDIAPSFVVALSTGGSGGYSSRQMSLGAARLNYNIYTAGDYATIWGDGTSGTATQSYSSLLLFSTVNFNAFGRIPVSQYVTAGGYTDTITVTVTF